MRNPIADLTPADLRRWLQSKPSTAIVGTAGDCTACVIALWLTETLCTRVVATHSVCLIGAPRQQMHRNPAWMTDYIWTVDDLPTETGMFSITAAAALELLARVERMEVMA